MERIRGVQSFGNGNVLCGNVTNGYNKAITPKKTDDEGNQIKQWLSLLELRYKDQSVQTDWVDGVGGWLLEKSKSRDWSGSQGVSERNVLFCCGDLGMGKAHIG